MASLSSADDLHGAGHRRGVVTVLDVSVTPFDNFPIHQFFDQVIAIRGGQAPAQKHSDKLLQYVVAGKVKLDDIITHRLPLSEAPHGYDIFRRKKEACVKVELKP